MSDRSTLARSIPISGATRGGGRFLNAKVRPKNLRLVLARLYALCAPVRKGLGFVFFLVVLDCAIGLAAPLLIGKVVDAVSDGKTWVFILGLLGALGAIYVLDTLLSIAQARIMAGVSQRIVMSLRSALIAKLHHLPLSFFDTHSHGDIMSRLTNDIDNIGTTISQSTTQLMNNALMIAGSLVLMLVLSPLLTLASLITVPLVWLLSHTVSRRTRVYFKSQQDALGAVNGRIEEASSGLDLIREFGREGEALAEFSAENAKLREVGFKAQIWAGFMMPLMNVISNLGFVAIAGVGGLLAVGGFVRVGLIASFLGYSRQFTRPLNDIANIYNVLQTALAGAERLFEILDEKEEAADNPKPVPLLGLKGAISFENVDFSYPDGTRVISDLNLDVKAGENIALIGPTGAGKTTIINLIARFYEISAGRILLDGVDIRDYPRETLRKSFGLVLQDTYLFSGTIAENIAYGRPGAGREQISAAAETALAAGFIEALADGYDTVLSESGVSLSQGQRQLIAIARAVLCDAPILILDEATSNVDTRTEAMIRDAMAALMKGRTSFVVAHRLSTIRNADRIILIDGGKISEAGSHEELMRAGGKYRRMILGK